MQGTKRNRDGTHSSLKRGHERDEKSLEKWGQRESFSCKDTSIRYNCKPDILYFIPSCLKVVGRVCGNSHGTKTFAETLPLCTIAY